MVTIGQSNCNVLEESDLIVGDDQPNASVEETHREVHIEILRGRCIFYTHPLASVQYIQTNAFSVACEARVEQHLILHELSELQVLLRIHPDGQ